ncbi:hypothetical protein KCM76_25055 [Zooshikella marina]|uniref:hypothetical protein n=1 Tax=Zooshikella ganghwensis TaxID=202772 RepID=UPI001BB0D6D4|nr:hypothetical protein [Zooshikella ganghwensis]MBU2709289.1 hypothetical protein [Zooshikella ganghwensis]
MKKTTLSIVIFLSILSGTTLLYFFNGINKPCSNLHNFSDNKALVSKVWGQINTLIENYSAFQRPGISGALIYPKVNNVNLGIDWDAVGIPEEYATLQILGKNLDYENFNPNLVDEVILGYGFRETVTFKIKHQINSVETSTNRTYSLSVECRR